MLEFVQNLLVTILAGLFVFSLVVFVHEFGHFQVGRWCGIKAKSFSFGWGSEWFGWTDKSGTRWKVSTIPIGGFVSWVDDADGASSEGAEEFQSLTYAEARQRGHYHAQPIWRRAATAAAGPAANFVFSIAVFAVIALIVGGADYSRVPARIAAVMEGSAAAAAGVRPGDVIRAVDGQPVGDFIALRARVSALAGEALTLEVEREGQTLTLEATPQSRNGMLGVTGPLALESEIEIIRYNPLEALAEGAVRTWSIIDQTLDYLGAIFAGRESGDQIAGPLGILSVSGQVASSALEAPNIGLGERIGVLALSLFGLTAMISVALGFANLLPIPVLDGGQLVLYAIEALRGGRPLPVAAQNWAKAAGLLAIGCLFLYATWNDIARQIVGSQG